MKRHSGSRQHACRRSGTQKRIFFFYCNVFFSVFRSTDSISSSHQSPVEAEESVAAEGAETQEETTQIPQETPKQRHLQHARPHLLHPRQPPLADRPLLDKWGRGLAWIKTILTVERAIYFPSQLLVKTFFCLGTLLAVTSACFLLSFAPSSPTRYPPCLSGSILRLHQRQ